jgi:hypothetical protein
LNSAAYLDIARGWAHIPVVHGAPVLDNRKERKMPHRIFTEFRLWGWRLSFELRR